MPYSVIYGPPGTGKSTAIINKVNKKVAQGVDKNRIGLCSFTKAASKVLAERSKITENVGTIHSLAFKLLGLERSNVVSFKSLKLFSRETGFNFRGRRFDEGTVGMDEGDFYVNLYNLEKAKSNTTPDYNNIYHDSEMLGSFDDFLVFIELYEKYKQDMYLLDFNDMLKNALNAPVIDVDTLFIDEAQDLSPLQWAVIRHWESEIKDITIAGDDDQAIYEWGGAHPKGMQEFTSEYSAEVTVLEKSYRIPSAVHKISTDLIENISDRKQKNYLSREFKGTVTNHNYLENITDINHNTDTFILYRTHAIGREVYMHLVDNNIPFIQEPTGSPLQTTYYKAILIHKKIKEGTPLKKREEKTLLKHLSQEYEGKDIKDIIHNIKDKKWDQVIESNDTEEEAKNYLEAVIMEHGYIELDDIHLKINTIHSVKGKEAERVILINDLGLRISTAIDEDVTNNTKESEIRVFYVGVTRTKKNLEIVEGEYPLDVIKTL